MTRCAVIGAGISGLATTYYLRQGAPHVEIDVYEASSHIGGVLRTATEAGCILEGGPDSFLTEKKAAAELCAELNVPTVSSKDAQRKTYIFVDDRLKLLPAGFFLMVPSAIGPFITADLLTWPGKFDVINDLFASPESDDCSVGEFVERRFGREILDIIAEPLLAGVYGADVQRLSLKDALPRIWELQKEGSLLLHTRKFRGQKTTPAPLFTTVASGMHSLAETLKSKSPGVTWHLGRAVKTLEQKNGLWIVEGKAYETVVVACAGTIESTIPAVTKINSILGSVKRNSAIVVLMAFREWRASGFGWLVPSKHRRSVMACTYVSNKFSGRTPEDLFLLRVFLGGSQAAYWIEQSDDALYKEARSELKRIAQLSEAPVLHRIYRWPNAMPEYAVGHSQKIGEAETMMKATPGLFFTGNLFAGVGIPDCISHAKITAERIVSSVGGSR